MNCYEVELLLPDYIDMLLNAGDKKVVEEHLKRCTNCAKALAEYQQLFRQIKHDGPVKPGAALREKFETMLQRELNIAAASEIVGLKHDNTLKNDSTVSEHWFYKAAAAIILIACGYLAGVIITGRNKEDAQVAQLKNEIREMKETLAVNMLNESSASERIKAVSYAEAIADPDSRIIEALIKTMNEDRNVNVRLAALYAVARFTNDESVTEALITSLIRQHEPLMQIALINILTERKEKKAKESIREILQDKKTLQPVKDIAQKGLNSL